MSKNSFDQDNFKKIPTRYHKKSFILFTLKIINAQTFQCFFNVYKFPYIVKAPLSALLISRYILRLE